ncbi:hypothetical protein Nepgr_004303 [Nepenthes gracilis]|uniref:BHLH domain-containing protein n=1 Tax=Nepenthes gracilis TaxID=150966 RepID=A0AAD3S150_NEPGR|nr:hypothetical protein Nepgr_004303 [Nepenthes gracilis]
MDNEFFLNAGMPTPPLEFEESLLSTSFPTWESLSSAVEIHAGSELNCPASQSSDCFLTDHTLNFESALSSMVSSPDASNSAMSNNSFMIKELIGKLGNICNSGEISRPVINGGGATTAAVSSYASTNNSCYRTPSSSPPKISMPIMENFVDENFVHLGSSIPLTANLPAMPPDPGFAERAARFSSFGSCSFNGRTSQFGLNSNPQFPYKSTLFGGSGKLQRVSSSPTLKEAGSQMGPQKNVNCLLQEGNRKEIMSNSGSISTNDGKFGRLVGNSSPGQAEFVDSRENSSVSKQNPGGENGFKPGNEWSSRKRKAAPKGKVKENCSKVTENGDDPSAKRSKSNEGNGNEGGQGNAEKGREDDSKKQSTKTNQKPPEPPTDYIHVRARRGQATDSHSLAERVRREKISERMKLLQDLVPGCNKVTGKALMLDEIISYVQSLQRKVEFLSMKLASMNSSATFNMDNHFSNDIFQANCSPAHQMCLLDSFPPPVYGGHRPHQINPPSVGPSLATLNQGMDMQLPPIDGFTSNAPQLPPSCEGDLQAIVQMGFPQMPSESPIFKLRLHKAPFKHH